MKKTKLLSFLILSILSLSSSFIQTQPSTKAVVESRNYGRLIWNYGTSSTHVWSCNRNLMPGWHDFTRSSAYAPQSGWTERAWNWTWNNDMCAYRYNVTYGREAFHYWGTSTRRNDHYTWVDWRAADYK